MSYAIVTGFFSNPDDLGAWKVWRNQHALIDGYVTREAAHAAADAVNAAYRLGFSFEDDPRPAFNAVGISVGGSDKTVWRAVVTADGVEEIAIGPFSTRTDAESVRDVLAKAFENGLETGSW